MNQLRYENGQYIYEDSIHKTVLLDCTDLFANKSRIPMHSMDGNGLTIPNILQGSFHAHQEIMNEDVYGEKQATEYLTMDILLVRELIRSREAVRVAEIGATNGVLSWHLANILGLFHPDSLLCSVTDTLGNESGNLWLDYISRVEKPCRLSLVAAEYEETNLQEDSFDITLVNGSVHFEDPNMVLKEAERITKNDGLFICYQVSQPLLESTFKLLHPDYSEYRFLPYTGILTDRNRR